MANLEAAPLSSPALHIKDELQIPFPTTGYNIQLFSHNRQLLNNKKEVVILIGSSISKKLIFEEDIVTTTYTSFNNSNFASVDTAAECLVVCFRKSANIYYPDGRSYVVSFPFVVKKAFPFESGLILEKDQNQVEYSSQETLHMPQLNAAKFLTLVDPIGDFRVVSTSSTSVISPNEVLMTFPRKGLNKTSSLCATFNPQERNVIIYSIRTSSRGSKKIDTSTRYQRKSHTLISTPNPSRVLEDEIHFDASGGSSNINQNALSMNMEKKRTSTLLSDASLARMGTEGGFPDSKRKSHTAHEVPILRKDMILTRTDVIPNNVEKSQIQIFGLHFEEQEAIVVVNKLKKETRVYMFKRHGTSHFHACYTFHSKECIPLNSEKMEGFLISLKEDGTIVLINPFVDIVSPSVDLNISIPSIQSLQSSHEEILAVMSHDGVLSTIRLILEPYNDFVLNCLKCFKYLSGSKLSESIRMLWRTAVDMEESKDEWNAFVITLLAIIYPFEEGISCTQNEVTKLLPIAKRLHDSADVNYSFSDLIPYIALSLHLLREEARLDCTSKTILHKLGVLLTQLTVWMGWPESWTKYYMINFSTIDTTVRFLSNLMLDSAPNLIESLSSLFSGKIIRYLTFSQLVEESDSVDSLITPRTHYILKLFEIIVSPSFGPNAVVDMMCEYGITRGELETYPPGISIPLKEAISLCQENPSFAWTNKTLELVGRKDLTMFLSKNYNSPVFIGTNVEVKSIGSILSSVLSRNESISPWDGQSEADRIGITKLIFDYDRRYYEITTLLHQTKTQTATLIAEEGIGEYDLVVQQRGLAAIVALRTLTIPLGRAALFYAGRKPVLTEKFPVPKFNLNTLISPTMTNIILSDGVIPNKISEWGYFHNGASSGLSISREAKGITGSWIIFNKPPELNSQHAGFLLGLGLNGHLKKLEEWHIYNYLGPKHPLTSVGLLIGMAASIRGSMDNKLTKVLSVHAVALLPQGANDLNVPIMVQTAGLIGIGLLYLESQHRRMSEILLSQVTSSVFQNDTEQIHEGYRLAAGISLGLVNLGKGNDLSGLNDTHVVDKLLSLAISMKDYQPIQELDKSCCGAIMALGFIYIRTENVAVANKLKVPTTEQLLDYVRPDLLLLRCIARNLILWNEIGTTIEWVESEVPPVLFDKYGNGHIEVLDSDQLGYFNILGGSCLSMAVKHASSHDVTVRETLLHYLDMMMNLSTNTATNYDQKIAYHCAGNIRNLIALSLSVVMAGSGDLETFRRLRVLHNDTNKESGYGNYMSINTALGFLFLGGGQFAFNNSNFAIASLITSLYPIFPNENSELDVHLQALRHFWALSVEPRCLIIRDVNSQNPLKIPVTIMLKNGERKEALSPCLLPPLDDILTIQTRSSDYFNAQIDFELNSEYLEIFKKSLTVFVYKRRNFKLLSPSIGSLLKNENKSLQIDNGEIRISDDISKLLNLEIMNHIDDYEKQVLLYECSENDDSHAYSTELSIFNIIDKKIDLARMAESPSSMDDLWNLKLLFSYTDRLMKNELHYVSLEFVEQLKQQVWSHS
ncbi:anaphase-promoting complex, subunit 1 [Scheffersomyces xylosifermentans]|uniref:anaphase-promoting complex, subunit 1 n=1 Tax=Scheffersomyces xylosifermentans TaxID=1304137 RepID=UPI00315DC57F